MKTFEEYQYRFSIPHNKVNFGYKYAPKTKKELRNAIEAEIALQGPEADLNCIDTSKITDMTNLFNSYPYKYAESFNGDISSWNVSNVEYMRNMFGGAKSFNQDISDWDVSKVRDMANMFCYAESFNQDISNWDVSNVTNMCHIFDNAKSFNQDISEWDVSNVKNTYSMFDECPIKEEYKPKFK